MDAATLKAALKEIEPVVAYHRATIAAPFRAVTAIVHIPSLLIAYEAAEAQLKILEEGK